MRINRLSIQNFKKYANQEFVFDPHFNLLIGNNGAGKTTILDAVAVAAGVWLLDVPDPNLSSQCSISPSDVRQTFRLRGERDQTGFFHLPVIVCADGLIQERACQWKRTLEKNRTRNVEARSARALIKLCYQQGNDGDEMVLPVIAYYGAGRASYSSYKRSASHEKTKNNQSNRWAAFYDCLSERIRFPDIKVWFETEAYARGNRDGQWRPGFNVVRWALLQCLPGLSEIWFNPDIKQMMFEIDGRSQPLDHLSMGQRMMAGLVADIAIKMVTQNAHLIPPGNTEYATREACPSVLRETPGVVLIDELDAHLHPSWQRRIVSDLKRTFPQIQFICATHSPQLIGELQPNEIMLLSDDGNASYPPRSFGLDSNRVLEEIMEASPRNQEIKAKLNEMFSLIDNEDLDGAKQKKAELESELGDNDPELTYAESLISFLEMPLTEE